MGLASALQDIRKEFMICGADFDKPKDFQNEHERCLMDHYPNITGAQYKYTFIEDGLGVFKQVQCCCGAHIDLVGDYDLKK